MTATARQVLDRAMSEADFQHVVIRLARYRGWHVVHNRPSRSKDGSWSTPIQGDPGAPDLLLARAGVVLHVELKREGGYLSSDQRAWRDAIGESYRLWRPRDWDAIAATLGEAA